MDRKPGSPTPPRAPRGAGRVRPSWLRCAHLSWAAGVPRTDPRVVQSGSRAHGHRAGQAGDRGTPRAERGTLGGRGPKLAARGGGERRGRGVPPGPGPREGMRGGGGVLKRPKVGSRQPSPPSHLHGTKGLFRAGFAQPRPDPEEKKLFPGCGSRARGGGGLAGRGATCGRSRPPGEARRRRSPPRWPPPCSGTAPCAW